MRTIHIALSGETDQAPAGFGEPLRHNTHTSALDLEGAEVSYSPQVPPVPDETGSILLESQNEYTWKAGVLQPAGDGWYVFARTNTYSYSSNLVAWERED